MCNTSENSLFNGTSLDSVACEMLKSIKEQTDGHGSCNLYLGNYFFANYGIKYYGIAKEVFLLIKSKHIFLFTLIIDSVIRTRKKAGFRFWVG